MDDLVIVGCGGFGREVADIVDAVNDVTGTWNLLGFVDDAPTPDVMDKVVARGVPVLGAVQQVLDSRAPGPYVIGIGSGAVRQRLAAQFEAAGWRAVVLVHPMSAVSRTARLGPGSIVAAHAAVGADVVVGAHVHLDRGTQVGHDCQVGDYVTAHPAAVVSGACHIGAGVRIGTHATVLPGVTVGDDAVIGAAACVVQDVRAAQTVKGVPAR